MRLKKEVREEKERQIKEGYLICECCKEKKDLIWFQRFKHKYNGEMVISYRNSKCKSCIFPDRDVKPNLKERKIDIFKRTKTKKHINLSNECKVFLERLVMMKGYIDSVEAFKLAHHHINTFGYIERVIINIEDELILMFNELMEVYNKCDNNKNKKLYS